MIKKIKKKPIKKLSKKKFCYREDKCLCEKKKHTFIYPGDKAPNQWQMKYKCPILKKWISYETELKAWGFKTVRRKSDVLLTKVKKNYTIPC